MSLDLRAILVFRDLHCRQPQMKKMTHMTCRLSASLGGIRASGAFGLMSTQRWQMRTVFVDRVEGS